MKPHTQRYLGMACALPLALLLAGCHKKPKTAHHNPPPLHDPFDTRDRHRGESTQHPTYNAATPPRPHVEPAPELGSIASTEVGMASWYGPPYHNRQAANGQLYDQNAMTAAHRTLPMGSTLRVTNLATGQSANVTITDRGPFVSGRILDLSLAAAKAIGVYRMGVAKVKIEVYASSRAQTEGRWCVQVGAFQHEGNANKLKSQLMRRYTTAKVIEFAGPTGHWVRINPTAGDKTRAQQIADNIHTAEPNAQPYLVRLD